jgi:hypothetical protein
VGILLIYSALWALCYRFGWVTALENGGMEDAQVLVISLSLVLFLFAAVSSDTCERLFYFSLVLLCVSFILRELDMEDYGLHPIITGLTSGAGRNLLLGFLWACVLLSFLKNPQASRRVLSQWTRSFEGRLMMVAGLFFLSAWPLDKEMFQMSSHTSRVLEELLELNGYFLFGLSSVSSYLHKIHNRRFVHIREPGVATERSHKSATVHRSIVRLVLTRRFVFHPGADREELMGETDPILTKRISRLPGADGKRVVRRKP